jgi:hypothetical protein
MKYVYAQIIEEKEAVLLKITINMGVLRVKITKMI